MSKKIKSILIQNVSFCDWNFDFFAELSKKDIFQWKMHLKTILQFTIIVPFNSIQLFC